MYIPRYFRIEELVPPAMHEAWKHAPNTLFMLFDTDALRSLDALRHRYGPIAVNTWAQGGPFRYSGWRPWDCSEGAALSQHKLGRAFDCKFHKVTAEEVRHDLACRPADEAFTRIRRVEAFPGMSWFHFDTGNHDREAQGIFVMGAPRSQPIPPFASSTGAAPCQI